jgi:hypothetical protein
VKPETTADILELMDGYIVSAALGTAMDLKGRLVIVDKFAPSRTTAPPSRLSSAFLHSLQYPAQSIDFTTTQVVQTRLQGAGFRDFSVTSVPHEDNLPWNIDWIMLEARKNSFGFRPETRYHSML